mgnify:CR=1 FL=1
MAIAAGSEVLEQLPEGQRREATAYTLAGLAHTLDLGRVVIGACPHVGHDLARRTAALLPAGDLAIAGGAKSLFDWRRKHGFCANCGALCETASGGWKRRCPACGSCW